MTAVFACSACGATSPPIAGHSAALARRAHVCAETCVACGWRKGFLCHRGLCTACYSRAPRRQRRVVDVIEDAEWLADDGATLNDVLSRLGVKRESFRRALARHGRDDLYWRLANREPDAEFRRRCSSLLRSAS